MTKQVQDVCADNFGDVAAEWLRTQMPQLKAASVAKYINILNLYLLPEFGVQPIGVISRRDVILFSRKLLLSGGVRSNGLAPKTINSIISVLKNIFDYASVEKEITTADLKNIYVKQSQQPMRILSRNEQHRLSLYLLENPSPCHLGMLLCLYTGLRIGEICALKWEDVCLDEQYIYVHQSMQRIQMSGNTGKRTEIVIQPPKSDCSIRKIPIPNEIHQLLISFKSHNDAFLLTGTPNRFIEPRCMENHFKVVVKECNIQDINFHALRHTFATRCIELGFDIKSLSEILGHASVNITLNRYVHPSMELKQKNMNMLSGFLTIK